MLESLAQSIRARARRLAARPAIRQHPDLLRELEALQAFPTRTALRKGEPDTDPSAPKPLMETLAVVASIPGSHVGLAARVLASALDGTERSEQLGTAAPLIISIYPAISRRVLAAGLRESESEDVLYTIAYILGFTGDAHSIASLSQIAVDQRYSGSVRGACVEAVVTIAHSSRSCAGAARSLVARALGDLDPQVRFWACFGVGTLRIRALLTELERLALSDWASPLPGWHTVAEEAHFMLSLIRVGEYGVRTG